MKDDVVLITGAGSGIGRAVALLCAERGARVAALDNDPAAAAQVVAEIDDLGTSPTVALDCDVRSEAAVASAVDRCVAELGTPTSVFANAGIEVNAPPHEMSLGDWRKVLEVNLTGTFLTCKHALRAMLAAQSSGSIVCTASPSAFVGFAGGGNGAYGASKGGVAALVRSMALDYARYGIRINAVVPGATDTPMLVAQGNRRQESEVRSELEAEAALQVPLRRLGQPREVAYAVAWLMSQEAAYVTGTHLVCDGGLLAKSANTF